MCKGIPNDYGFAFAKETSQQAYDVKRRRIDVSATP